MSKRGLLKTLAFLCGLYFMLDFLLPAKLGGDFDGYSVHSPSLVVTPDGPTLFYVGTYSENLGAVGRLVLGEGRWTLSPAKPVLQRSLFVPHDRAGMAQLDVVALPDGLEMLYIGYNKEVSPTLCRAVGDPRGLSWKKEAPVLFGRNGPPLPTLDEPNGKLPGELKYFAAERVGDQWQILLVVTLPGTGLQVWEARGESLSHMQLGDKPVLPAAQIPEGLTAFDGRRVGEGWQLYFAAGSELRSLLLHDDGAVAPLPPPRAAPVEDPVVGLRAGPEGRDLAMATSRLLPSAPEPEYSNRETRLLLAPLEGGAAAVVKTPGRKATPTYLSRGVQWAGNFLQILGSFAVFLAMINLSIFHGKRVLRRQKEGGYSLIFFACLGATFVFTLFGKPDSATGTIWKGGYDFLFKAIVQPMGTAVFSMITFYMISAAYRSFRVRNAEAAMLMVSACIVMIGQMPIGQWLGTALPDSLYMLRVTWMSQKLLTVINSCAYRGVLIGLSVGALSISLRIWLGLDNSVYSGLESKS